MKLRLSISEFLIAAIVLAGIGIAVWRAVDNRGGGSDKGIKIPEFSAVAQSGKAAFDANCASCHGENAAGSDKGPPLMHDIYNPGHHADEAFLRAVRDGVAQHHWRFGNMPPQPKVSNEQLTQIVRYMRELQQANGINFRPHRM